MRTALADMAKLQEKINAKIIKSPGDHKRILMENFEALLEVASKIPKSSIANYAPNITHHAFFGSTSTGKSTLVNLACGRNVAETGAGETTTTITPYPVDHGGFVIWDLPGKNDAVSYYSADILGLVKCMSAAYCLFRATPNDCLDFVRLVSRMEVPFYAVLTMVDHPEWTDAEVIKCKAVTDKLYGGLPGYQGFLAVSGLEPTLRDTSRLLEQIATSRS